MALLQGNFGIVDHLREKFEQNKNKSLSVAPAAGGNNDDEDDDEEDSDEEMGDADVDSGSTTANAHTTPGRTGPVVDEDGFELVQSRRRR